MRLNIHQRILLLSTRLSILTLLIAGSASAVVFDSTGGNSTTAPSMFDDILNSNSSQRCLDCHSSSQADVFAGDGVTVVVNNRHGAPLGADFDNNATGYAAAASRVVTMEDHVRTGYMPMDPAGADFTDALDLSGGEMAIVLGWLNDGAPKAAPTVASPSTTSVTKISATLRASINPNVHAATTVPATANFEYGTSTAYGTTTTNITALTGITGSAQSTAISGLSCGTTYNFRANATNGDSTTNGSNTTFATSACTAPTITGPAAQSTTEDVVGGKMFSLSATAPQGGMLTWSIGSNGGTDLGTYSFVGSNTGNTVTIKYVPDANANGTDTNGLITVTEAGASGGISNNIVIMMTITPVNDQPAFNNARNTTAIEGAAYTDAVTITDPDSSFGSGLTMSLVRTDANGPGLPGDMRFVASTGVITWNPSNADALLALSYDFELTVSDGNANGTMDITQSYTVTLQADNAPPVITSVAPNMATEDIEYIYQMVVLDEDDSGTQISYTLANAPDGMAVSTLGKITWTPLEGVLTSAAVTITVEDGNEDVSPPDTETFTVMVLAVNDAPMIDSTPDTTPLLEGDAFSYQVIVVDPDDSFGSGVTMDLVRDGGQPLPENMTFDADTGLINWTVGRTNLFNSTFNFTVTVADDGVGADDSTDAVQAFTLITNPIDTDSDGVADYIDNCPITANADQADNDGDTQYAANAGFPAIGDVDPSDVTTGGDVCDTDDDNDGITDVAENLLDFLNPFDAADAQRDEDNDGFTNLQEFINGTTLDVDSAGPVVTPPATLKVDATGFLTMVDIGTATALDAVEGNITSVVAALDLSDKELLALSVVELLKLSADVPNVCGELSQYSDKPDTLTPGKHQITWAACDSLGNIGLATQEIRVRPILSVSSGSFSGEGLPVSIKASLIAPAAEYPVTVDYTVSGTATFGIDHDAPASGTLTFANIGDTASIDFNVLNDSITESDETVIFTFSNPTNAVLGSNTQHTLTITDENIAPQVSLVITQNGEPRGSMVYGNATATVTARASDANGDTLSFDWSESDSTLLAVVIGSVTDSSLKFNLPTINTALVKVKVSDGSLSTEHSVIVVSKTETIIEASDAAFDSKENGGDGNGVRDGDEGTLDQDGDGVADSDEGLADDDGDGIPNFKDNNATPPNVIESQTGNLDTAQVVETEPGLSISLGATAIASGATGVHVSAQDVVEHGGADGGSVTNAETGFTFVDALFSFEIAGLTPSMQSVNIVLPLASSIPEGAVYRKYIAATGWAGFVEDDLNMISSAKGGNGVCPEPGSDAFTPGLTALDSCVQLTIQDGGANDADSLRNFIIKDPGGLALAPINQEAIDAANAATEADANSSGRAGAMNPLSILLLLISAMVLASSRRTR